jgi:hypothetical protein
MIEKTEILKNLKWLETRYNQSKSARAHLLYSKLAIIEICGWLEMTIDDVITRCAKRCIKHTENLKEISRLIKSTHGFTYDQHFRKLLVHIIGFYNFEKMEKAIDQKKLADFQASLLHLSPNRKVEAHTYIKGTQKKIDGPTKTAAHFNKLYVGLLEIEKWLRKNRF